MPTATELAEEYIEEHPSIKDCLRNNVVNYSKLSRKIAKELSVKEDTSLEAILVACRRYAEKLKLERNLEEKIIKILKKSELEIKNKIVIVIVNKRIYHEHLLEIERKIRKSADVFYSIEGVNVFTVIITEKYLSEIKELFKHNIVKISRKLAMITIKSPSEIENTPGVTHYLYSIFMEHGINIVETMSCWTDTVFVISEESIPLAMKYLKF